MDDFECNLFSKVSAKMENMPNVSPNKTKFVRKVYVSLIKSVLGYTHIKSKNIYYNFPLQPTFAKAKFGFAEA